ncbi:hypothetical protein MTO96_027131 [Rhipicephalus appendiculatus]
MAAYHFSELLRQAKHALTSKPQVQSTAMPPTRTPLLKLTPRQPPAPLTEHRNTLLDLDHQPELYPASGIVAAAGGRGVGPVMTPSPRSPRSPDDQHRLAVNPVQFTKSLVAEDVRMQAQAELVRERRANLIYGAGIFVAIACLLTLVGAIIFGNHVMDDAYTVREGQSPTSNYSADGSLLVDADVVVDRGELLRMPLDVGDEATSAASFGDEVVLSSSDNLELDGTTRCSDCVKSFPMDS